MSLYDYANGDPVNYLDPDGRLGAGFNRGMTDGAMRQDDSSALSAGYWLGGMFRGFSDGLEGGRDVTLNSATFGATDAMGLTLSDNYQGGVYDFSRAAGTAAGLSGGLALALWGAPIVGAAAGEAVPGMYVMAANAANNPVVQTVGFSMLAALITGQNQGLSGDQQLGNVLFAGLIGRGMAGPGSLSAPSWTQGTLGPVGPGQFVMGGPVRGPEGASQFLMRGPQGIFQTAGVVRAGDTLNRVFDTRWQFGLPVSQPMGGSFAPGHDMPSSAAIAIAERGLTAWPRAVNNAQLGVVWQATQNIPATFRTSIGGTAPEVLIGNSFRNHLSQVSGYISIPPK